MIFDMVIDVTLITLTNGMYFTISKSCLFLCLCV